MKNGNNRIFKICIISVVAIILIVIVVVFLSSRNKKRAELISDSLVGKTFTSEEAGGDIKRTFTFKSGGNCDQLYEYVDKGGHWASSTSVQPYYVNISLFGNVTLTVDGVFWNSKLDVDDENHPISVSDKYGEYTIH